MLGQLPPLNGLRAFEAAARHLSIKQAADELCVTPSAVSQSLKVLEDRLGTALFHRVNRGIFLTEAGQSYLPAVRNAFRQIAEATARIAKNSESRILTVSTTAFFAAAWLVPRLSDFEQRHPEIELRVLTSRTLANFARDGVDIAVRHGAGRYPGLCSEHLLAMDVAPVAAPDLVTRRGRPDDRALARWPHVHDAERRGWQMWFEAHGVEDFPAPRGPSFDDTGLLLQAVLAGRGAGLLPAAMVSPEVETGRLVQLAEPALLEDFAYYLVYPEANVGRASVAAFRSWVLEQTAAEGRRRPALAPGLAVA